MDNTSPNDDTPNTNVPNLYYQHCYIHDTPYVNGRCPSCLANRTNIYSEWVRTRNSSRIQDQQIINTAYSGITPSSMIPYLRSRNNIERLGSNITTNNLRRYPINNRYLQPQPRPRPPIIPRPTPSEFSPSEQLRRRRISYSSSNYISRNTPPRPNSRIERPLTIDTNVLDIDDYDQLSNLSPIATGLNLRTMNKKTKIRISNDTDETCVICLASYIENDIIRELPCKHTMHQECIDYWFEKNNKCPLCRHKVEYNSPINSRRRRL